MTKSNVENLNSKKGAAYDKSTATPFKLLPIMRSISKSALAAYYS